MLFEDWAPFLLSSSNGQLRLGGYTALLLVLSIRTSFSSPPSRNVLFLAVVTHSLILGKLYATYLCPDP